MRRIVINLSLKPVEPKSIFNEMKMNIGIHFFFSIFILWIEEGNSGNLNYVDYYYFLTFMLIIVGIRLIKMVLCEEGWLVIQCYKAVWCYTNPCVDWSLSYRSFLTVY